MPFHLNKNTINRNGRRRGSKNKRTLEIELAQKHLQEAIIKNITPLTVAAINAAMGERFIYRIDKGSKGGKMPPELVTDPHEIAEALDAIENDASKIEDSYYYISTKPMNTHALQQLFDRAFGKPRETVEHRGAVGLYAIAQRALLRQNGSQMLPEQKNALPDGDGRLLSS